MARLSRAESQALTRKKLLDSAYDLYRSRGYHGVKIEEISERAGFSRGAFYANFDSKEAIFLEILKAELFQALPAAIESIRTAKTAQEAIDRFCEWTDQRVLTQDLSYLFLQIVHYSRLSTGAPPEELAMVRAWWAEVARAFAPFFPNGELPGTEEEIGAAIVLPIADGPFVESLGGPSPSRLLRLTLTGLLRT